MIFFFLTEPPLPDLTPTHPTPQDSPEAILTGPKGIETDRIGHVASSLRWGRSLGFGKRGLLEKGSFQRSPFSRDFREFRDSRDFREPPDSGK